jgi:hypothetical protein
VIDAASERSEQGRFLSKSPDSSNAGLDCAALGRRPFIEVKEAVGAALNEQRTPKQFIAARALPDQNSRHEGSEPNRGAK